VPMLLIGCVTVNEDMLRKVSIEPPKNKEGLLELKTGDLIQTLNGSGQNRGVLSGTTVLNLIGESTMTRWVDSEIIKDYQSSGKLKRDPDYTLIVAGTRNEDSSMLAAVLGGLSLGLIPLSTTISFDLNFDFLNNHTQKHYLVKTKSAYTVWSQILLFPALPFSWAGRNSMMNDVADNVYYDLRKQGAFIE